MKILTLKTKYYIFYKYNIILFLTEYDRKIHFSQEGPQIKVVLLSFSAPSKLFIAYESIDLQVLFYNAKIDKTQTDF